MTEEDLILIHKHLRNELSPEEQESFNRKLSSDTNFKNRFQLESQVYLSLDQKSWSFVSNSNSKEVQQYQQLYKSPESKKLLNAILDAQRSYKKSHSRIKRWSVTIIAAAVIIAISTILLLPENLTNQELYSKYLNETELIALVDRGRSDTILTKSQISFENKDFFKVIELLTPEITDSKNSNVYLYLAISQMEIGNYEASEQTLDKLTSSDLLDAQKGYWFKSLLYIKSDRLKDAKLELEKLIENNFYNTEKALELLEQIN